MSEPKQEKTAPIQRVRFHQGVQFAHNFYSSLDANVNKATISLHPLGVLCEAYGEKRLVFSGMIHDVLFK